MLNRERTAWVLVAALLLVSVAEAVAWQNSIGWSSLTVGTGTEALAALFSAGLLASTLWFAKTERDANKDAMERMRVSAALHEAQGLLVWPFVQRSGANEPLRWAVAIQNTSRIAIPQWELKAGRTSAMSSIGSRDFGTLRPIASEPLIVPLPQIPINQPDEIEGQISWRDALGRNWRKALDGDVHAESTTTDDGT